MEIDKQLYSEIKAYCIANSMNPKEYIHKLLKKAFMIDKYGETPPIFAKKEENPNEKVSVDAEITINEEIGEINTNISQTFSHKDYYIPPKIKVDETPHIEALPIEKSVVITEKQKVKPRKRKLS